MNQFPVKLTTEKRRYWDNFASLALEKLTLWYIDREHTFLVAAPFSNSFI